MPRLQVTRSSLSLPARIVVGESLAVSAVSASFGQRYDVALTVDRTGDIVVSEVCSGAVTVRCLNGRYVATLAFPILQVGDCDVLLASDWVDACRLSLGFGMIVGPSFEQEALKEAHLDQGTTEDDVNDV